MKADSYKVRVTFKHGNAMSLDLKGCGSIYIEPNKDYFFENAPMQFINYLAQLRRLGVTYRLTNDKKGCYMTIDLSGYQTNEPKTILGQLRSNLVSNPPKITRYATVKDSDVDTSTVPDLIPNGTFPEEIKEIELSDEIILNENEQVLGSSNTLSLTPDDLDDDSTLVKDDTTKDDVTVSSNEPVTEQKEQVVKVTDEELSAMNKTKLIELAKSLGVENASEIWTKKELRSAITDKLAK